MVIDPCMCTGPTAELCQTIPQYRKLDGCDSDGAFVESMIQSVLEIFAKQTLSKYSDIVENADVESVARLYRQHCTNARSGFRMMAKIVTTDV